MTDDVGSLRPSPAEARASVGRISPPSADAARVEGTVGEPGNHSPPASTTETAAAIARQQERNRLARRGTAIHEAGHATGGLLLGLPIQTGSGATIRPTLLSRGHAWLGAYPTADELLAAYCHSVDGEPIPEPIRTRIETAVIATLCGPLAQGRALEEGIIAEEPPPDDAPEAVRMWERDIALIEAHAEAHGEKPILSDAEYVRLVLGAAAATEREASTWQAWLWDRSMALIASSPVLACLPRARRRARAARNDRRAGCVEILEVALARASLLPTT